MTFSNKVKVTTWGNKYKN